NIKRGAARAARERSSPLGSAVSKWSTVGSVIICILAQRALSYAGESVRVNYKSGSGLERNIASERRQACGSSLGRTRKCMKDWMAALSAHLRTTRRRYPNDRLMVLFDVDGTILDMRYMVYHTLQAYDAAHGTHFFDKLQPTDITVHEDHVTRLLADLNIAPEDQPAIIDWYKANRWTREAVLRSHQPYEGVFDVIRWIQNQPGCVVGLNTGRPESIRAETLASLNMLGAPHRVAFRDDLLHMNPYDWQQRVPDAKVSGVIEFQARGYRVVAVIDNEPENLRAIGALSSAREILLLHA